MKQKYMTLLALTFSAVLTALLLTSVTFAWFTNNQKVGTNQVHTRAGSDLLELQISRSDTPFRAERNNELTLAGYAGELLPVSTADLSAFFYNPITENDQAKRFERVTDESMYYHERIYLRVVDKGMTHETPVELYLDNTDIPIVETVDGELLTASRLGLRLEGEPTILSLSNVNRGSSNTVVDDVLIGSDQVLGYSDSLGKIVAVKDPAIPLENVQVTKNGEAGKQPLGTMTPGVVYGLDIYFYLEGCDPDCTNEIVAKDSAAMNLAFYVLPAKEENQP